MSVVFGREVDGEFLGIAVSWHYGSAIGAVLAWVGLTLGIAQRLERGPAAASSATRLPANNREACYTCTRGYIVSWAAGVLHTCWSPVAAIVWTNGEFAGSFTALDFHLNNARMRWQASGECEDKGDGRNVLCDRRVLHSRRERRMHVCGIVIALILRRELPALQ